MTMKLVDLLPLFLPFSPEKHYYEMSSAEAKTLHDGLLEVMESRLTILQGVTAVRLDHSDESLDAVFDWLIRAHDQEKGLFARDYCEPGPGTVNAIYYVGFYFAECLRAAVPQMHYEMCEEKKNVNFNMTVLMLGAKQGNFEPSRIMRNMLPDKKGENEPLSALMRQWRSTMEDLVKKTYGD